MMFKMEFIYINVVLSSAKWEFSVLEGIKFCVVDGASNEPITVWCTHLLSIWLKLKGRAI